jgi:integrase
MENDMSKQGKKSGPHVLHRLSDLTIKRTKAPGAYADGGGLYLQVAESGAKSWLFRYSRKGMGAEGPDGKPKGRAMGLGPLHTVTLLEARDEAMRCRKLLLQGIDPIEHRKIALGKVALEFNKTKTFDECAAEYIATLAKYITPVFGALPVQLVDVDAVYRALIKDKFWTEKTETATRVRQRVEAILDSAAVSGYRQGENPARWDGLLEHKLPKPSKIKKVEHMAALPYGDLAAFIVALQAQNGVAARALEFMILTVVRTGPIRFATWAEIDFEEKAWNIPGAHMKTKEDHRVPLCARAIAILEEMQSLAEADHDTDDISAFFIFPGGKAGQAMSENGMLALLNRMNATGKWADEKTGEPITPHGFRSTFSTWVADKTTYQEDVREACLAHKIKNAVIAAYQRGTQFDKRRALMDDWGRFAETKAPAKVVSIKGKSAA